MKLAKNIAIYLNRNFFYRWHPEVALRYLPIADELKKLRRNLKILEVGSGGLGIVPYLGLKVTGVDTHFEEPLHPRLSRITASADKLPFRDSSFDTVLSVDMLEHLSEKTRGEAISEMVRVAKQYVFIAVPVGRKSYAQDVLLDHLYQKKYGKRYKFLEEQIENKLPEDSDMVSVIKKVSTKYKKNVKITVRNNENLELRLFLMKGWLSDNVITNIFFRKILLIFIPIFKYMNSGACYRKIYKIEIV